MCSGANSIVYGNIIVTSHHETANQVKVLEVTRDKKVVWTYTDDRKSSIHHFQILDTDGKVLEGKAQR